MTRECVTRDWTFALTRHVGFLFSADALYLCYCLDRESGARSRDEVFKNVSVHVCSILTILPTKQPNVLFLDTFSSRARDIIVLFSDDLSMMLDIPRTPCVGARSSLAQPMDLPVFGIFA